MLIGFALLAYQLGRMRSVRVASKVGGTRQLHSLPSYYGYYAAIWAAIPALLIFVLWLFMEDSLVVDLVISAMPASYQQLDSGQTSLLLNQIKNLAAGVQATSATPDPEIVAAAADYNRLKQTANLALTGTIFSLAAIGLFIAWRGISPSMRARVRVERVVLVLLFLSSGVAVLTTVGIVLSVLFESIRFFQSVPLFDFVFGLNWSPQTALRADQVGSSGSFGAVPLFAGTMLITVIAMMVSVPVGLMSAIYLSEYASNRVRSLAKPVLEILAGIPTVVYGFFAAIVVAPFIRDLGDSLGIPVSSESALAAGLVMGVMIIPFVSSISDDVINSVPQALRDASLALGATKSETVKQVIIPAALPGIVGGILLAVSRALGETMIVVMAAGLSARLTANPLESVTTVTVQIVTLLVGDQEFDSPKTLAAFALGLMLFTITLTLNVFALHVVRKYREKYD